MKIYHFSDTHTFHGLLTIPENIDIMIFSGDASNPRDPYLNKIEVENFITWYSTIPVKYKIFVAGNHDTSIEKNLIKKSDFESNGIIYLENDYIEIEGLKIWGSPITPTFGDGWAFNKNVYVLPNAINPNEQQFKAETLPSDKLRFGWLGGSSHLHDLKLLDGTINKLKPYNDKFSMYLCGFDIRGSVTEINKETGEQKQRPIRPEETVWARYEEIFTDNYRMVTPEHKDFLMKFKEEDYVSDVLPFYNRIWTKPVTSYAANYRWFDVSLAPIKNHIFNRVKSQLKVIEAGFYKKAIIASNVGPYTIDLKHSLKNGEFTDGNALLVDEVRNGDWCSYRTSFFVSFSDIHIIEILPII